MRGRTVILVSHHIRLCAEGAAYIVALDRGTAEFQGGATDFRQSEIFRRLLQTKSSSAADAPDAPNSQIISTSEPSSTPSKTEKTERIGKAPKFVADEVSSVGRIPWAVWTTYLGAVGNWRYWLWFANILLVSTMGPVFENGYLRIWTDAGEAGPRGPIHYVLMYGGILCIGKGVFCWTRRVLMTFRPHISYGTFHDTLLVDFRLSC
jgi:hypothetical protein